MHCTTLRRQSHHCHAECVPGGVQWIICVATNSGPLRLRLHSSSTESESLGKGLRNLHFNKFHKLLLPLKFENHRLGVGFKTDRCTGRKVMWAIFPAPMPSLDPLSPSFKCSAGFMNTQEIIAIQNMVAQE